jgi:protein-disulfide isomerase
VKLDRFGVVWGLLCGVTLWTGSALAQSYSLFSYQGQEVKASDLSVGDQLGLFEIEEERFTRLTAKIDDLILAQHFAALAKTKGVSRLDIEKKELSITEPSDKDASKWFEENKSRLPSHYSLDQIKDEIKSHLREESLKTKRTELLRKLKDRGDAKVLVEAPRAPTVTIKTDGRPERGAKNAKVTIVEFADYQCPHCKSAGESIEKILKTFDGKVRLVFLDFPINPSGISLAVAHGAVCADDQGKYWPYHDKAYAAQRDLSQDSPLKLARELKLDEAKFQACMASDKPKDRVKLDRAEGERLGISGTPAVFINGRRIRSYEVEELKKAIDQALSKGA